MTTSHSPQRRPRSALAIALSIALPSWLAAVIGLLVAVLAPARPASAAGGPEDRRALLEAGKTQRLAGDELEALAYFQRAHRLAQTPESFGLMGASEYNLNRQVDAEVHLAECLSAKDDPWVKKNGLKLTQILATVRSLLGWIEVVGTPAGADVEVAGRAVGKLPLPGRVRVAAGEVNVRLAAGGYKVARKDVEVLYDQVTRVNIDLERATGADPGDERPGKVAATTPNGRRRASSGARPVDVEAMPPPSSAVNAYRTAGWVTAGAAVVLAGAGVAALIVKESNTKDFNTSKGATATADHMCNQALKNSGGGTCPTFLDRMNAAQTIAVVAFVGAGLAGIVSGILLTSGPSEVASTGTHIAQTARTICLPTVGGASDLGGTCRMSF